MPYNLKTCLIYFLTKSIVDCVCVWSGEGGIKKIA